MRAALRRAEQLADLGLHHDALDLIEPLLAAHPDDAAVLLAASRSTLLVDPGRALGLAQRAGTLAPSDDHPLRLQAWAHSRLEQPHDARMAAERAILLGPESWLNHYVLAMVMSAPSTITLSRAAAARAVRLAPHEPRAHLAMARTHLALTLDGRSSRDVAIADHHVHMALQLDPHNADALELLAQVTSAKGQRRDAAARDLRALREDPNDRALLEGVIRTATSSLWMAHAANWVALGAAHLVLGTTSGQIGRFALICCALGAVAVSVHTARRVTEPLGERTRAVLRAIPSADQSLLAWVVVHTLALVSLVAMSVAPTDAAADLGRVVGLLQVLSLGVGILWVRSRRL